MQHTAAATTHQQSEKNPKKPAKSTLLSLPQQSLTTDHVCSTWLRETGQLRENSDLLYPMRDGTLFQSYKCKCANKRLEHFIHWHWHQLHEKSKCSTSVITFIEKYSFHSSNVKPGCTRNIQNIHVLSLLFHWTSENLRVHFPIHIHPIPFSMQMAQGRSWFSIRFKTFPCLLDSCYQADFPTAPNDLLVIIPTVELQGSSLHLGEPVLTQNSKSRGPFMQNCPSQDEASSALG